MSPSVVESKIANFEAKNRESRSTSTPTSSIISADSSHLAISVASRDYDVDNEDATSTASVAASESRKSRIRQQLSTTPKSQHPTNLMEKRNQIKERRSMVQQKQAQEQKSSDNHNNSGRGVTLTRKTGYPNTQLEEERKPVVTPIMTATEDPNKSSKVTNSESSPSRRGNRLSKMQRMQQRKRGSPAHSSAGTPTAASTASTAVARNHTPQNEQSSQPRQHHYEFQNSGPKRTGQFSPSPPPSPGSEHRIPIDPNGVVSPSSVHDNSFINLNEHTTSPRSGMDADASVDPATDDDATLTSVRRIMENTNNRNKQPSQNSPSNHSHQQYQSLQAHRKQRGRTGSTDYNNPIHVGGKNTNNNNVFSSNGSYSRNRMQQEYRNGHKVRRHRDWLDEEKSEKEKHGGGVFRTPSSSDYDTDGDISKTSNRSNALEGPSQSQATDVNDFFAARSNTQPNHRRTEDDERTFDYGDLDRDDDSNDGSASHATRKLKEAQRRAVREQEGKDQHTPATPAIPILKELPLINKDDIEHYKKSMDTPAMKVGAGFVGVATVGCLVFGPVGLLVGAAAVGVGFGVMKLPEEKRNDMQEKATRAMNEFHEKAMDASDQVATSCANSSCVGKYKDSGVAEHLPPCFDLGGSDIVENESITRSEKVRGGKKGNPEGGSGGVSKNGVKHPSAPSKLGEGAPVIPPTTHRMRNKNKVACLRSGKFESIAYFKGFYLSSLMHSFLHCHFIVCPI
jgi:hypothetical protein